MAVRVGGRSGRRRSARNDADAPDHVGRQHGEHVSDDGGVSRYRRPSERAGFMIVGAHADLDGFGDVVSFDCFDDGI